LALHRSLEEYDARLVLQIHDEVILEVAESQVDEVVEVIEKTMTGVWDLKSGLEVKVRVGETWGELGM
jgi:DNA polymerase I